MRNKPKALSQQAKQKMTEFKKKTWQHQICGFQQKKQIPENLRKIFFSNFGC